MNHSHDVRSQTPGEQDPRQPQPMRVESRMFVFAPLFFVPITLIYGFFSGWEPVGTTALTLITGFYFFVGGYMWLLARRVDVRPEDDPLAEVDEHAGEIGLYSPHSWWPLVCGIAVALVFLGVAVGWWVSIIGVMIGLIGLVGHVYEHQRGHFAH